MKRGLIVLLILAGFLHADVCKAENSSDWGILLQNMANTVNANNNTNTDELTKLKTEYKEWNDKISVSENSVQKSFSNLVSAISPK